MRALISEHSCKAVLFERAPDMCLKWDLYVNGVIPEELEADIEVKTRVDKIIQLYVKEGDKAVIHAHTSHTNKMSDFFFDVVEQPSMGNYIYSKYGDKYFSIGFQVGEGLYTQDDSGMFSKTVTDTLQTPIPTSFEYSALKVDNPYFYYPTDKLPEGISNRRIVTRERKNSNQFFFCSIKKRFNGLIFIRDNSPLNDIEQYPAFYTNGLMQIKDKQQRGLLSGSK